MNIFSALVIGTLAAQRALSPFQVTILDTETWEADGPVPDICVNSASFCGYYLPAQKQAIKMDVKGWTGYWPKVTSDLKVECLGSNNRLGAIAFWRGNEGPIVLQNFAPYCDVSMNCVGGDLAGGSGLIQVSQQSWANHALAIQFPSGEWKDIHPATFTHSFAWGTDGHGFVGVGEMGISTSALWWPTLEAHAVDLSEGHRDWSMSRALGVSGSKQVGEYAERNSFRHAVLWSGSADSAVDLNPRGYIQSKATGIMGSMVIGQACQNVINDHAAAWDIKRQEFYDLHLYLPKKFSSSCVDHIDPGTGVIVGYATEKTAGLLAARHRPKMIFWYPNKRIFGQDKP